MELVLELIEENFVGVIITLFLMLFVLTNNNFEKRTNRFFLASTVLILIVIIEEAWEARLALSPTYEPLRVPLSALGYTLRPLIPYLTMLITKHYPRKQFILLTIPAVFNGLVSFSALFCGISFSYSADNQFVRGPLGYTPFAVAAFYIIFVIALTFITYRDMGIREMLIISAIVCLAFLATVMESWLHIQFIQCPGMATSLTFYYMFLHSNYNNRDPLTESLTRRRFYLDSKRYYATLTAVISVDLNDLKQINDQHSHMAGDKALSTVARTIKAQKGPHAFLYRVGGDEFMLICYKMDEKSVKEMIERIQNALEETEYRCAIGYAMKSNRMNFDSVCHVADNRMYENKRQMKEEKARLFPEGTVFWSRGLQEPGRIR